METYNKEESRPVSPMEQEQDECEPSPEPRVYCVETCAELKKGLEERFDKPYRVNRQIEEGKPDLSVSCPWNFREIMHGANEEVTLNVRVNDPDTGVTYIFHKFNSNLPPKNSNLATKRFPIYL